MTYRLRPRRGPRTNPLQVSEDGSNDKPVPLPFVEKVEPLPQNPDGTPPPPIAPPPAPLPPPPTPDPDVSGYHSPEMPSRLSSKDPPLPSTNVVTLYCLFPLFSLLAICLCVVVMYTKGCLTEGAHDRCFCNRIMGSVPWAGSYVDFMIERNR